MSTYVCEKYFFFWYSMILLPANAQIKINMRSGSKTIFFICEKSGWSLQVESSQSKVKNIHLCLDLHTNKRKQYFFDPKFMF